eukprot:4284745-Heterocapsa_arctica.AAC.1
MLSKTKRSKVHPPGRKVDRSLDQNKWGMKFRPVGIMSIVLDVDETTRPSACEYSCLLYTSPSPRDA